MIKAKLDLKIVKVPNDIIGFCFEARFGKLIVAYKYNSRLVN